MNKNSKAVDIFFEKVYDLIMFIFDRPPFVLEGRRFFYFEGGRRMGSSEAKACNRKQFMWGVRDCLPTVLGYLSVGFAAGVVEYTAGMSMLEIFLVSLLMYAGAGQFVAAGMIIAGAPPLTIILTVFIINMRHFLLSAVLAPAFKKQSFWQNLGTGFLITDETFGVAANQMARNNGQINYYWMQGLNITAYLNWILANMLGGYFGQWISNPADFGLDFALAAMFIGLLVLQISSQANLRVDLVVIVSSVVFTVIVSPYVATGINVMIGASLAAVIGMVVEKWNLTRQSS